MTKLSRMLIMVIVAIMVVATLSINVNAYTNAELKEYLTTGHSVNGMTFELTIDQKDAITSYLASHPVTDAEANKIKSYLDSIESKVAASGVTDVNQLSADTKASILADAQAAGAVIGVSVSVNQEAKTVTLIGVSGTQILSTSYARKVKPAPAINGEQAAADHARNLAAMAASANNGKTLLYTGANYSIVLASVVAIIAVAVVVKKHA